MAVGLGKLLRVDCGPTTSAGRRPAPSSAFPAWGHRETPCHSRPGVLAICPTLFLSPLGALPWCPARAHGHGCLRGHSCRLRGGRLPLSSVPGVPQSVCSGSVRGTPRAPSARLPPVATVPLYCKRALPCFPRGGTAPLTRLRSELSASVSPHPPALPQASP